MARDFNFWHCLWQEYVEQIEYVQNVYEYLSFISFCETYWLSIYKEEEAENP